MQTTEPTAKTKKPSRAKKSSTLKKTTRRKPKMAAKTPGIRDLAADYLGEARSYLSSRTSGQKAALAAGAVGFLGLLANRRGRGLLKTLGGLALPVAASYAQDKIVERASRGI